ncbi:hypothetical protein BREVNS_0523 [Brevinematales bacterium NS]|nr:hypothetical protein BREVNS_0523 [Brevinematales bacterium NS]
MHRCFFALAGSGATPLSPAFSVYKGLFVFFIQKNGLVYYGKEHFYTTFCFFITFLRPLYIRAKVSVFRREKRDHLRIGSLFFFFCSDKNSIGNRGEKDDRTDAGSFGYGAA